MAPSGILESALYADDINAAEAFYRDVLGLERLSRVGDRHVFFRCGDGVLLIFNPERTVEPPEPDAKLPVPPHGMRGQGHVCFRASEQEIDGWKARLSGHGIAIETEFEWPKGGRSIYFRDPSGNSIEFANPKIWGL